MQSLIKGLQYDVDTYFLLHVELMGVLTECTIVHEL